MKEMYNVIAYWLKYYRNHCELTQQDVADLLGLDRTSYAYYESGKTTPDIETLIRLAAIFNVELSDLFLGCNARTGKYVSDESFANLCEQAEFKKSKEQYAQANFEAEILLRLRSLPKNDQEDVMSYLDDLTGGSFIKTRRNKFNDFAPRPVHVPEKELEMLKRANVKYLPQRPPKKKEGRIELG